MVKGLPPLGITYQEFKIAGLLMGDNDIVQKNLANRLNVCAATLSIAISKLAERRIVRRVPSTTDKRVNYLELIPSEKIESISQIFFTLEQRISTGIGNSELEIAGEVLSKLIENLKIDLKGNQVMTLFIIGIIIFFSVHVVPSTPIKLIMIGKMGEVKFKGMFSIISIIGLGLIIFGFSQTEFQTLWAPAPWGKSAAFFTMPIVTILMCAAEFPNNLKRLVRHPMLLGVSLWGLSHLAANGDLASTILFSSFLVFSVIDIIIVNGRGNYTAPAPVNTLWDLGVIVLGLTIYGLLFHFHGSFTGMPLR